MKRVLLTGASGFIGRYAIPALIARGYEVHCICRSGKPDSIANEKNVIWHQGNLLQKNDISDLLHAVSPTDLLHLAWDVTPGSYLESIYNFDWVVSSLHLLKEFAESGGTRAVCAGTCFEYDLRYGYCIENLTPIFPTTYYGSCKHLFQSIGERYAVKKGFNFAWGRIFFLYGPYENPTRLVPSVIQSLLKNEPAKLTHGNQIRDFLHVVDVADAFAAILDSEVSGIINIGSGKPVSIRDLVMQIAQILGKEDEIRLGALPAREDEPQFVVADTSRLNKEIQWIQKYSLTGGIMDTLSWWKNLAEKNSEYKNF
jgi:nucleoside-diphosphate-sugar epimerase